MRFTIPLALVAVAALALPTASQSPPTRRPAPESGPVLAAANNHDLELSPEEACNVRVYDQANRSVVNITTRGRPRTLSSSLRYMKAVGPAASSARLATS